MFIVIVSFSILAFVWFAILSAGLIVCVNRIDDIEKRDLEELNEQKERQIE